MAKLIYDVLIEYYNCNGKKQTWHVFIIWIRLSVMDIVWERDYKEREMSEEITKD